MIQRKGRKAFELPQEYLRGSIQCLILWTEMYNDVLRPPLLTSVRIDGFADDTTLVNYGESM